MLDLKLFRIPIYGTFYAKQKIGHCRAMVKKIASLSKIHGSKGTLLSFHLLFNCFNSACTCHTLHLWGLGLALIFVMYGLGLLCNPQVPLHFKGGLCQRFPVWSLQRCWHTGFYFPEIQEPRLLSCNWAIDLLLLLVEGSFDWHILHTSMMVVPVVPDDNSVMIGLFRSTALQRNRTGKQDQEKENMQMQASESLASHLIMTLMTCPFSFFLSAFPTSFTPLLILFSLEAKKNKDFNCITGSRCVFYPQRFTPTVLTYSTVQLTIATACMAMAWA